MLSMHTQDMHLKGHVERHVVTWPSLIGNPGGDSPTRPVVVYLPDCYGGQPDRRFPVAYVLHGFNAKVDGWLTPSSTYGAYLPEVDRLMTDSAMPPAIVVFVDGSTSLGGSQYVDSPGTGRYQTYMLDNVVPWVDQHFATFAYRAARVIQGHSSGGLGALLATLARPDLFAGVAASAPDALYEHMYLPVFADAVNTLRQANASFEQWQTGAVLISNDSDLRMCQAVAACFSPDNDGRPILPFDTTTASLIDDVWARWLQFDPFRVVLQGRGLSADLIIRLNVGVYDDYRLCTGAHALAHALRAAGVRAELTTELTDHDGIVASMPSELASLASTLEWATTSKADVPQSAPNLG